jgi:hypothetical protein
MDRQAFQFAKDKDKVVLALPLVFNSLGQAQPCPSELKTRGMTDYTQISQLPIVLSSGSPAQPLLMRAAACLQVSYLNYNTQVTDAIDLAARPE